MTSSIGNLAHDRVQCYRPRQVLLQHWHGQPCVALLRAQRTVCDVPVSASALSDLFDPRCWPSWMCHVAFTSIKIVRTALLGLSYLEVCTQNCVWSCPQGDTACVHTAFVFRTSSTRHDIVCALNCTVQCGDAMLVGRHCYAG